MATFRPFSTTHAIVLLAFVATTAAVIFLRRRLHRLAPRRADALDRAFGLVAVLVWLFTTLVQFLPRYYDRTSSLPLHLCDFTIVAVPLALFTCWRPARAITYFWGIGLSTQGLITPDLEDGPAALRFWLFWTAHFVIVGGALYEILARRYRPTWRDCLVATGAGLVYVALILPFDIAAGLNYGYVGKTAPGQPSLVDALGPWPGRVGVMLVLGGVVMAALAAPWEIARLVRRRAGARPPALPPVRALQE
jgi:hypothetical integral membrane protein (TIGR02206 family)